MAVLVELVLLLSRNISGNLVLADSKFGGPLRLHRC